MPRIFKINVNGTEYDVAVEELTDGAAQLMPRYTPAAVAAVSAVAAAAPPATPSKSASAPAAGGAQLAQMGGIITQILVKTGQSVNEGDKIAELEAMKMKVPVIATCAGSVTAIHVAVGDAVEGGQALLTIA